MHIYSVTNNSIEMYEILTPYTLAGIEPTVLCSKRGDADHYNLFPVGSELRNDVENQVADFQIIAILQFRLFYPVLTDALRGQVPTAG
jgi:hypothetical protein